MAHSWFMVQSRSGRRADDGAAAPKDWPETIIGRKYVRMIQDFARTLRPVDAHGNRTAFLDDVFIVYLLAFFNPLIRSLRTLDDFSQCRQAQAHISVPRLPRSTLSDLNQVADPDLLLPLLRKLQAELPAAAMPDDLAVLLKMVIATDGSFFAVAADAVWAVLHRDNDGKVRKSARLDCQLNVATGLPEIIDICGAGTSEPASARKNIIPGAVYVDDRGYFDFQLMKDYRAAGSEFVIRMRAPGERTPKFVAESDRPLTEQARAAGVISDGIGRLAGSKGREAPDFPLREVVIASPDEPGGTIRLLTDILDMGAAIIGILYRYRWQVELFFRWLKVYANFEHLISASLPGIKLSFYTAMIGIVLMSLHTQTRPSKYAMALMITAAGGGASLEELAPILARRTRERELERARRARKKAAAAEAAKKV